MLTRLKEDNNAEATVTYSAHELLVGSVVDFRMLMDDTKHTMEVEEAAMALDDEIARGLKSVNVLSSLLLNCSVRTRALAKGTRAALG